MNSKIQFEDTELTIEDVKSEKITVNDIVSDNSIYFINEEKEEFKIEKTSKVEEFQEKKDSKNNEVQDNKKKEKFIHIYKNGDVIKMRMFDINITLSKLRNLIKEKISENSRFLSEGTEVPISDEK